MPQQILSFEKIKSSLSLQYLKSHLIKVFFAGDKEVGHGSVLVLDMVSYTASGQYQCRAGNIVHGEVTAAVSDLVSVQVSGAPEILTTGHTHISATASDNVELEVEYCSNPSASIEWTDGNGNILSEVSVTIIELDNACFAAKMLIPNVSPIQSGLYQVTVENEFGKLVQEFNLTVENDFLSLELLLATVLGFVLTILFLLFIIITLCQRQRRNVIKSEITSRASSESETYSRDNSSEELIFNTSPEPEPVYSQHDESEEFSNIYGFPRSAANGGSLRKDSMARKVCYDSAYIHINTNAYSYVSFDDVDKQISDIL